MVNFWERIKSQNIVFILFLRRYKIPKEDIIAYDVHFYIRLLPFPHRMHPKTSSVWQNFREYQTLCTSWFFLHIHPFEKDELIN